MPDYPPIVDAGGDAAMPDSWQEVYFANALHKFDIPFYFQYAIGRGGGHFRGGIIVDFVIIRPFYQPIEIFGKHWHQGELGADDRMKLEIERKYFGREVIVIWSDELPDQDSANKWVRSNLF